MALLSTTTGISWAADAMTSLMGMVTSMIGAIKEEPVLAVYFVAGFAGIAIGILSRLKRA